MTARKLGACFDRFQEEVGDLMVPAHVPVLREAPSALSFLRDFVACNRPCVIKGLAAQWKATTHWTTEYMRKKVGHLNVSVEVTPNGRADAIVHDQDLGSVFALPHTAKMPFSQYLDPASPPFPDAVSYVSHQNSRSALVMHRVPCSLLSCCPEGLACSSCDYPLALISFQRQHDRRRGVWWPTHGRCGCVQFGFC